MDPTKDSREVCGTCEHNSYDWEEKEYTCSCEASDCYGCPTGYMDHCEEWSRKG